MEENFTLGNKESKRIFFQVEMEENVKEMFSRLFVDDQRQQEHIPG
jgi:hypothetical protein